jgi:uncharacterized protein YcbX
MVMNDTARGLGRVTELYRYPVKSMQGLAVESLQLGPDGVEGDRGRALIETASGGS